MGIVTEDTIPIDPHIVEVQTQIYGAEMQSWDPHGKHDTA